MQKPGLSFIFFLNKEEKKSLWVWNDWRKYSVIKYSWELCFGLVTKDLASWEKVAITDKNSFRKTVISLCLVLQRLLSSSFGMLPDFFFYLTLFALEEKSPSKIEKNIFFSCKLSCSSSCLVGVERTSCWVGLPSAH